MCVYVVDNTNCIYVHLLKNVNKSFDIFLGHPLRLNSCHFRVIPAIISTELSMSFLDSKEVVPADRTYRNVTPANMRY